MQQGESKLYSTIQVISVGNMLHFWHPKFLHFQGPEGKHVVTWRDIIWELEICALETEVYIIYFISICIFKSARKEWGLPNPRLDPDLVIE